ncbi:hypothetical protein PRZ48_008660 [Zasmidium cellare]|uniref:Uncharacterized protein n=1 Tax=Zasmidium cellare TaxID=395010 RepID=A0ABR0EGU0_ZASCE|nr:hypothetical protein PRZ48_008660 [Zasmidium cellare]
MNPYGRGSGYGAPGSGYGSSGSGYGASGSGYRVPGPAGSGSSASASGSGAGQNLARPRMYPAAQVLLTRHFAQNGLLMREWMFMTPQQLAHDPGSPREAQFDPSAPEKWGWTVDDTRVDRPRNQEIYGRVLNGLRGVSHNGIKTTVRDGGEPVQLGQGSVIWTTLNQDEPYTIGNVQQQATDAFYSTIFVRSSKLIIVEGALSPKCSLESPLPPNLMPELQHWSDLIFLRWARHLEVGPLTPSRPMPSPHWVMVRGVNQPDEVLGLISYLVQTYSGQSDRIPEWPGMTFPIGTYGFNALLGTPIGKAIAMFLITHKQRFMSKRGEGGLYTVDSITVFMLPHDSAEDPPAPSLMFHIKEIDGKGYSPRKILEEHQRLELETAGSGVGKPFPYPVTPSNDHPWASAGISSPQAGSSRRG